MKLYRAKRVADLGIWDAFISPATIGALAVLAIVPLIIPALVLWCVFVLVVRVFDRDSKPV